MARHSFSGTFSINRVSAVLASAAATLLLAGRVQTEAAKCSRAMSEAGIEPE